MIDSDVFDFVERCRRHTSTGPLLGDLLETVRNLGFEHLILSGVPLGGQKLAPMVELNGWPKGWFERYVEAEHAAVDGVCIYSAKTLKPFLWAEVPAKWSDTEGSRRVAGEATEFGICSGFAVPMLSVHHWQSVLSFASSAKVCKLSPRQQVQLVTMAVYALFFNKSVVGAANNNASYIDSAAATDSLSRQSAEDFNSAKKAEKNNAKKKKELTDSLSAEINGAKENEPARVVKDSATEQLNPSETDTETDSGNKDGVEGSVRYTVRNKAYFHNQPDADTKREAFINHWNNAVLTPLNEKNGFIYIVYTNHLGQTSRGWLSKSDLIAVK
jgi:hypothetical protein